MTTKSKINLIFLMLALVILFPVNASNFKSIEGSQEDLPDVFINNNINDEGQEFSPNMQKAIDVVTSKLADIDINSTCDYEPNSIGEMTPTKVVLWVTISHCSGPDSIEEVLWFVSQDKNNKWFFKKEVQIGSNLEFKVNSIEIDDRFVLILGKSKLLGVIGNDEQKRVYDDRTGNLHEARSK